MFRRLLIWFRQWRCKHERRRLADPTRFMHWSDMTDHDHFCSRCGKTWLPVTERDHMHAIARLKAEEARLAAEAKQRQVLRKIEASFGLTPTEQNGELSLVDNVVPIEQKRKS